MSWLSATRETIQQVHATLPADATEAQAKKALSEAYPFGERAMSPYKTWCHNVTAYLAKRYPGGDAAKRVQAKEERRRLNRGFSLLPESLTESLFGGEQ